MQKICALAGVLLRVPMKPLVPLHNAISPPTRQIKATSAHVSQPLPLRVQSVAGPDPAGMLEPGGDGREQPLDVELLAEEGSEALLEFTSELFITGAERDGLVVRGERRAGEVRGVVGGRARHGPVAHPREGVFAYVSMGGGREEVKGPVGTVER